MKRIWLITSTLILCSAVLPRCPQEELIQLIDIAQKIKEKCTSVYWAEWASIPMTIVLIEDEDEFLFNSPQKDTSFHYSCQDIGVRRPVFGKNLLATFPAVHHRPTIVVGTPANTGKTEDGWVATLLHEHFHQLQFSHPRYYADQKALGLDKGDHTGMWMLNHPFPYEDPATNQRLQQMAQNLLGTEDAANNDAALQKILRKHRALKRQLEAHVGAEHYTYFNLQLWQEGYARYMEMELTKDWVLHFDEIEQDEFTRVELEELIAQQESRMKTQLESGTAAELKRTYFYALGAAEAKLIAATNHHWKQQYFDHLFTTDPLLE